MRALLATQLDRVHLSFPEWTTLVFIDGAGALPREEVISRQLAGQVASRDQAQAAIERLRHAGLIAESGPPHGSVEMTPAGTAVFLAVRSRVSELTDGLYGDLPAADLDATHRTLTEIARRAAAKLAEPETV